MLIEQAVVVVISFIYAGVTAVLQQYSLIAHPEVGYAPLPVVGVDILRNDAVGCVVYVAVVVIVMAVAAIVNNGDTQDDAPFAQISIVNVCVAVSALLKTVVVGAVTT